MLLVVCQLSCDVMAMKILNVIGAFRSVRCHSQTVFNGWSICRLASHSLGVSFAQVRSVPVTVNYDYVAFVLS